MADDDWSVFIQWKGTDVCMDVYCPKCHHHNHYDGTFAYYVRCAGCGAIWELGTEVTLTEWPGDDPPINPLVDNGDPWDNDAADPDTCTCGADWHNAVIDRALKGE